MRLTEKEKAILLSCAEFVLAGEWPFNEDTYDTDFKILKTAINKLRGTRTAAKESA
jgi:hypothetical protein